MTISLETKIRQAKSVVSYNFNGRVYLMDPDKNVVRILNDSASVIWKSAKRMKTIAEVSKIIQKQYNVSAEMAKKDTLEFVKKYISMGYLRTT